MAEPDQAIRAPAYGMMAGPAFASIVGTWRKGVAYGFACGFYTFLLMAALLFPIYLGFTGILFRLT